MFVHFIHHGDRFYNRYINSKSRTKHFDGDGTGVKPKQIFSKSYTEKMCQYGSNQYSSKGKMWDRDIKNNNKILEEKENQLDIFIFLDPNTVILKSI